jgi:pyruvate dehydrogenase E1 component alpha subunit
MQVRQSSAGHDSELRRRLYREMARLRRLEERIAALYPEQEMRCPVHLSIGQEAVAVGACAALEREDKVMSAHRSHGHYLAKGGDMKAMLAELYGKATGCCGGKGGSMHLVDLDAGFAGATPIVGSTIPIAVGLAFAAKLRGERTVTTVFFGEAATEEGVFSEAILFAALKRLPIVFVCENNLYSVYSPMSVRQPPERDICAIATANGLAASSGDGNDVEEVYRETSAAVERARNGEGPSLLLFDTYRWLEHCGPYYDNHLPYREESEFETWQLRDPVAAYRGRLLEEGGAEPDELEREDAAIEAEIDDAVRFAQESPEPTPEAFAAHVYA